MRPAGVELPRFVKQIGPVNETGRVRGPAFPACQAQKQLRRTIFDNM